MEKHEEIQTGASTNFQFCRLPVRSPNRTGITHCRALGGFEGKTSLYQEQGPLNCQTVNVPHRSIDSNGETGVVRSSTHETDPMAPQEALACTGGFGQGDPGPPCSPSSPGLVVGRKECALRPTFASSASRSTSFYKRIKRRLRRSLRRLHSKRRLVRARKLPPYNFFGTKSCVPGSQEFRASLQGSDCPSSHGQHNCGLLHQQGRRYEIRLSLCPLVETSVLVPSQGNSPEGKAHSGSLKCDSGQTVQAQPGDPDRMVPVLTSVSSLVFQLGSPTNRPLCHPVQSQTSQVCVTGSGSDSLGCGRPQHIMGKSGCVRLSPSCLAQSSGFKIHGPGVSQNGANCTGLAQHGLVLGSGDSVCANPFPASASQGSGDSACQRPPTQESHQSKPACVAPRSFKSKDSLMKWQQELRLLREVQPEPFINRSGPFLSNGVTHIRWTSGHPL